MASEKRLVVGDQSFDLRLDFFVCPTHGLLVPARFESEWTTDEGCPVLMADEESCDERLTPVFLDSLTPAPEPQGVALGEEDRKRLEEIAFRVDVHAREVSLNEPHTGRGLKADAAFLRSLASDQPDSEEER